MQNIIFNRYLFASLLLVLVVAGFLYQQASNDVDSFIQQETTAAQSSANEADVGIRRYLASLRRNVDVFSQANQTVLQKLIDSPGDSKLRDRVDSLVKAHFVNAVTFTIADSQGAVILSNIESLVGGACQENIRLFSIDNKQSDALLRIHHNKKILHFDIMREMHKSDGGIAVFFITFSPKALVSHLVKFQLPGHQMLLTRQDVGTVVELTSSSGRMVDAEGHILTDSEQNRILAKTRVIGTSWELLDIAEENALAEAQYTIFQDYLMKLVYFIIGLVILLFGLSKLRKN